MSASITTHAPGSLVLIGEHAVLHQQPAIMIAIDQYMHVQLTPRSDSRIQIDSALAQHSTNIDELAQHDKLRFVLAALQHYKNSLKQGCDIVITSDFSSTVGFGSSAAVTVATLKAIQQWLQIECDNAALFDTAKQVMLSVQGCGSGADIAASVYGGCIVYQIGQTVKELKHWPKVCAVYSGYKTPTVEVIKLIEKAASQAPEKFKALYPAMGDCVHQAVGAIEKADWPALAKLFVTYQQYLRELGVSDDTLEQLISKLEQQANIFAAKISGAGLGDCVIGLGELAENTLDNQYQITVSGT